MALVWDFLVEGVSMFGEFVLILYIIKDQDLFPSYGSLVSIIIERSRVDDRPTHAREYGTGRNDRASLALL